ncbi:uncharacterized protein [Triticum aestivum]|uniref:uncharacterized protein isoform X1 n=1 Tax=Triticum aestivum TaxID=4565 RepID=UPI001D013D03|nr:uncharacterized protein LOC123038283 isoform X1 [Triticum aestivum]
MARTAPVADADTIAVLGGDLLREVFLHLPTPADLLRAALACKPFIHAARSARFLRRFRRRHPSACPLLLGCFVHRPSEDRCREDPSPLLLPAPLPAAARRVVEGGDFALSFLPDRGSSGPDPWRVLDSRSGRPLLWDRASAEQPVADPWKVLDCRNGRLLLRNRVSGELAVADPLTRRWASLPAPPAERPVGYGLVTDDGCSSVFQAFCLSEDGGGSSGLRALVLSSSELRWADAAVLAGQYNLEDSRVMQANGSLYWKLKGGERMVALNTATMAFSLLELPDFARQFSFDVIEKGDDDAGGLYLLTMLGCCIEVWGGWDDGSGVLTWTLVDKSVRFQRAMAEMIGSPQFYRHGLVVIAVVAGVVFLRNKDRLLSIDLETMKLRMLVRKDECPSALMYPYTMAWPPSCLNPTEQAFVEIKRAC